MRHMTLPEQDLGNELAGLERLIVKNMPGGVCLIRASDAVIVYANPGFERMFGYGPGELNGKPVVCINYEDSLGGAEKTARVIIDELTKNGIAICQVRNVKKNGTAFWCQTRTTVCAHPTFGTVWVAIHEDIDERKQAHELLEAKVWHLEAVNRVMMDREHRILELKEQVRLLQQRLSGRTS